MDRPHLGAGLHAAAYRSPPVHLVRQPVNAPLRRAFRLRSGRGPAWEVASALAVWLALLVAARLLIERLYERGINVHVGNAPLVGALDPRVSWRLVPAVALGALAVAFAPRLAQRLPWRALLGAAAAGSIGWALALAVSDGLEAIVAPLLYPSDYLNDVQRAGDPLFLLSSFLERADQFATHPKAHPPGLLALLSLLREAGLGGEWTFAGLILGGAALAPAAVMIAARELAGEAAARAAAPFLVVSPAALWIATSADALFMGVAAAGIALMALATGRTGRPGDAIAAAGGVVLGLALHLSYGVAPLGLLVVAVAVARRRVRPLLVGALGLAVVTAAFVLAGFWWLDGLERTRELYAGGISRSRPYGTFLLVSLAAFAVAIGPATAAGIARLRDHGLWLLAGSTAAAVLVADLSGLSKGETERIWLPFAPWVIVACAALAGGRAGRAWLGVQVAAALTLQAAVTSPW